MSSDILIHDSDNNILYKNINIEDGVLKQKVILDNAYRTKLSNLLTFNSGEKLKPERTLNKFFKFQKDSQIIYQNYLSGSNSCIAFYLNFDVNSSNDISPSDYICSFYFNNNGHKICSIQVIRDTTTSTNSLFKFRLKLHTLEKTDDNKYSLDSSSGSQYSEIVHPTPFFVNNNDNLFLLIFKIKKGVDDSNDIKFTYYNASTADADEDPDSFVNIPITPKRKTLFESFADLLSLDLSSNLSLTEETGITFILGSPITNTEDAKLTALMKVGNIQKYTKSVDTYIILEDFSFDKVKVHCGVATKTVFVRDPKVEPETIEIPGSAF
jgi:hypothetical protein